MGPSGLSSEKAVFLYKKEKRESLYLSLVPPLEALALPIVVRTSNAEAHAEI